MKAAIALAIVVILACMAASEAGFVPPALKTMRFEAVAPAVGKPCKCMSTQACQGEVNSDVQCHPSFGMVCCVIPDADQNNDIV